MQIKEFIWPITSSETKKFLSMAMMLFFSLFNYNALRTLKDSFVVPNIGAESISFIKFFCVVPATIIFVIIYIKMTDKLSFRKIYHYIATFFICFFILYGFILYPNELLIHPDSTKINALINSSIDFGFCNINGTHFKWFFLVYNKWLYAIFYVISELWSVMYALLFWQFANQITATHEAKRFYPMFAFMGSFGTFTVGGITKIIAIAQKNDPLMQIQIMMLMLTLATIAIMLLFEFMLKCVIKDSDVVKSLRKSKLQAEMSLATSIKTIFSSRYLGYISALVLGYGVSLNLMEGPWKASVKELFINTQDYMYFMAGVNQWMGAVSMLLILVGAQVLRRYSWAFAAQITPIVFLTTGTLFFIFLIFTAEAHIYISSLFFFDPLVIAVYIGMAQIVIGKSTKYAFFDPTKEMSYIPLSHDLKSKGKAAVDLIGMRISRSGASFIQSMIFIVFPTATYITISKTLMGIFVLMVIVWIIAVKLLNKEYLEQVKHHH